MKKVILSCLKMNLKISHKLRQPDIFVKGFKKLEKSAFVISKFYFNKCLPNLRELLNNYIFFENVRKPKDFYLQEE